MAALGIGGGRCIDRELHDWVDEAPIVVEAREDLRRWFLSSLTEQFEQRSGLSANPEAIAVAEEYWAPHVDPLVAAEWEELREEVGVLSDRWGDTFAHQVRAVLPGPPGADEPW